MKTKKSILLISLIAFVLLITSCNSSSTCYSKRGKWKNRNFSQQYPIEQTDDIQVL